MREWRSYHVHYRDLDRLIVECVHPYLEREGGAVERRFWERHYAGGAHLRVRLGGSAEAVERVGGGLARSAEHFMAAHPSLPDASYSPERAAALLAREGEEAPAPDELRYRVDTVLRRAGGVRRAAFVSDAAAELAADFRHDAAPLAARLVREEARPRREEVLRLFFLQALESCPGDLPAGCVSYRSHWEGFAATSPPALVARIHAAYGAARETVAAHLREVAEAHAAGRLADDPVLAAWDALARTYAGRARRALAEGKQLTEQPTTPEEVERLRAERPACVGHSRFVRELTGDSRFLASLHLEPAFLVPRVVTNLLYVLVAAAGLSPIDRMALCHHAHRAAEEESGRDLGDILAGTVADVVRRHAHRWQGPAGSARDPFATPGATLS